MTGSWSARKPLTRGTVKDLGRRSSSKSPDVVARLVGADAALPVPARLLRTLEYTALMAPSYSLRGGTREILRGMIARGLGLR